MQSGGAAPRRMSQPKELKTTGWVGGKKGGGARFYGPRAATYPRGNEQGAGARPPGMPRTQ